MENYTKYALKPWEELAALLEDKENIFVVACNKCFKEFTADNETDCEEFLSIATVYYSFQSPPRRHYQPA